MRRRRPDGSTGRDDSASGNQRPGSHSGGSSADGRALGTAADANDGDGGVPCDADAGGRSGGYSDTCPCAD